MPACAQCGKQNPEGNVFCGSCGIPLAGGGALGDAQASHQRMGGSAPRPFTPSAEPSHLRRDPERRKRIEWIPWNHLTVGQKIGRSILLMMVLIVVIIVGLRVINRIFDAMQ